MTDHDVDVAFAEYLIRKIIDPIINNLNMGELMVLANLAMEVKINGLEKTKNEVCRIIKQEQENSGTCERVYAEFAFLMMLLGLCGLDADTNLEEEKQ